MPARPRSFLPRLLLSAAAVLAVAGGGGARAQGAAPVLVGAVLPQSGFLADLAADYRKGLLLWQEEANARGGLAGRRIELELLDDRSESIDDARLYETLIRERKADVLIGPFGSAASLGAAAVAERARRVMINATGASRSVHKAQYRYVFQSTVPFAAYGAPALEAARALGVKRLFILAREDSGARESAQRMREDALTQGFTAGEVEVYAQGAEDFVAQVAKARKAEAEAWIAFGLPQDGVAMVKTFRKVGFAPRLVVAQGAASPEFVAGLGQYAEYAVGIAPYDRRAATRGNGEFIVNFARKWSADPGLHAAEGYAAGRVLEEGARAAGSLEPDRLRAALAALETETPLGPYKVDRGGAQLAARPLLVQVLRGRREIVWPEAQATAKLRPYPSWAERPVLK